MKIPEHLVYPLQPFAADYMRLAEAGESILKDSSVVFVGLARNCGPHLRANLRRLEQLVESCGSWALRVETNDNTDDTVEVLEAFCAAHRQASFQDRTLGREHYGAEFAGRRTIALAEYRTACQEWVRKHHANADFVVVVDWDAWGGWSHSGFLHGVGALADTTDAYGMASVSLIEYPMLAQGEDKKPTTVRGWVHYDAWALRLNSTFDDYTAGLGGWKHQWLPPVGSPPVPVVSAFGGMAVYDSFAYLRGHYDGEKDCEHVGYHRSITERTGQKLYLDPSMRTVMHWMEPTDGGRDGDH
jgi:hypothetical protein